MDDLFAPDGADADETISGGAATVSGGAATGDAADGTTPTALAPEQLRGGGPGGDAVPPIPGASEEQLLPPTDPETRKQRPSAALRRVLSRRPDGGQAQPAPVDSLVPQPASRRMPWRRVSLVLSLALALLLGLTGLLAVQRASGSGSSPAPSEVAAAGATPSRPGTTAPSASSTAEVSASAVPATPAPSIPGPRPSAVSAIAIVTFHDLVVDSPSEQASTTRTFTFSSDGPGPVSIGVVQASPLDSTTLCYSVDAAGPVCASGGTPGFDSLDATTVHSIWTVTLVSAGKTSPIVDVQFSWPTDHASITLAHGRLQGAPNPDSLRDLSVTFVPRASGTLSLAASWPPAFVTANLTLNDIGRRATGLVDRATYLSKAWISPAYTHRVAAGTSYQLVLSNAGVDAGRPDLTATLTFP